MPQRSCQSAGPRPHRVVLLVDQGSNPFEMGCACEIFGARRTADLGFEPYSLRLAAPGGRAVMRDGLFVLGDVAPLTALREADTIVVPNRPDAAAGSRRELLDALRRAHRDGTRLIGLCTGAYVLAEAGLLDGRPAAGHRPLADDFRLRFPQVALRPDVLFVDDGDVLTSAGSAAALDLGLHVVRRDYGAEVANAVSRRLVFAAFRDGGQRQFTDRAVPPSAAGNDLAEVMAWARDHLDQPLGIGILAGHAHLSVTTLHRRFRDRAGTTPLAWLTAERVALARRLIEGTDLPFDAIARRSGLGTAANLRKQLHRQVGVPPSRYRRQFSAPRPGAGAR